MLICFLFGLLGLVRGFDKLIFVCIDWVIEFWSNFFNWENFFKINDVIFFCVLEVKVFCNFEIIFLFNVVKVISVFICRVGLLEFF